MTDKKKIGPWTVTGERAIFDNPWINVRHHDVVHPDGSPGEYGVVRFKNRAIGVLPIDEDGYTWLVGQHRFPLDKYSWELPEGGGPLNESALAAAKRELIEETGLSASGWREMCQFDISNSVTNEVGICFLAWGLTQSAPSPESSEELSLRKVPFKRLLEMVMNGEISDSLTIIMTLFAHQMALRGDAPASISDNLVA